jgi:3-phosphoshikimate 1-carboxyvinyltransferase
VLLAGLFADGTTAVVEPVRTRDHTEIALREFGAGVSVDGLRITLTGRPELSGRELTVPGDISSAAFFLVAALLVPGSALVMEGVGLNPTRAALLDFLLSMGAKIQVLNVRQVNGELVGEIQVEHSPVKGGVIEKGLTASLIDEIPVLAVLGAVSDEGLDVRDAKELRVKETDRIAAVAGNLEKMGVKVAVRDDGFTVAGRQRFHAAELDSQGDHRIAMAFSVAALAADGYCMVRDAGAASVSYPEFFDTLQQLRSE